MKEKIRNILTDWNWSSPIPCEDMRYRLLLIVPLALASLLFAPLLILLLPIAIMSCHRRYLDLFGEEFYAGNRIALVWIVMILMGLIPVVGSLVHLWMLGWWDRRYLRGLIGVAFEHSELI